MVRRNDNFQLSISLMRFLSSSDNDFSIKAQLLIFICRSDSKKDFQSIAFNINRTPSNCLHLYFFPAYDVRRHTILSESGIWPLSGRSSAFSHHVTPTTIYNYIDERSKIYECWQYDRSWMAPSRNRSRNSHYRIMERGSHARITYDHGCYNACQYENGSLVT